MPIQDILRQVNLFVDGRGYMGRVEEIELPKLTVKTEEFRAGGMDAPVELDMGMEKLESTLTVSGVDRELLKLWGVAPGNITPLSVRGSLQSEDGTVTTVEVRLRGQVKEIDWGTWKPGEKAPLKIMLALRYYKLTHGGELVHEIDVENMIRVVAGVDQLQQQRDALGI